MTKQKGLSNSMTEQDEKFLRSALVAATYSPDPSTQNGAVIVTPAGKTVYGCNRQLVPDGNDIPPERWERPLKYSFTEHAERNAIFTAAKLGISTDGAIMYCPWFACADCARAIVAAGIKTVIGLPIVDNEINQRWNETVKIGDTILQENGVKIIRDNLKEKFSLQLRINGQLIEMGN